MRVLRYLTTAGLVFLLVSTSSSYADDWVGTTSSDWFTPTNWSAGIPTSSTDVNLNSGGTFSPVLTAAGAQVNNFYIGQTSPNTFTINSGGGLSSANTYIGYNASGTALITGPNVVWNNSGLMVVAYDNTGTLTVNSGGVITSGSSSVGSQSGATGTVTLDGTGTSWSTADTLYIGENGSGTLIATDGVNLSSGSGYIGLNSSSTGFVLIDGAGTTWNNSGELIIANSSSSGELDISDGGVVTDGDGVIGANAGSSGIVSVSNAGTQWINNNFLIIGDQGIGTLTVSDGGAVAVNGLSQVNIGANSTLNIGAAATDAAAGSGVFTAANVLLNSNGAIVFNHTDPNYTFGPSISGSGSVSQLGAGSTTILTGTNSYTGGTFVTAGTLQGTTDSLQGSILDNSHVIFDQTNTGNFSGVLSGSGDLTKNNLGTVILNSANTYTGNTMINAGTLQIAAQNNLGAGASVIFGVDPNNPSAYGTLAVNQSLTMTQNIILNNNGALSPIGTNTVLSVNSISGTGSLIKSGTGVLLLNSPASNSGDVFVNEGILRAGTKNVLASTPMLQVANGAEFDMAGLPQTINNLNNNGVVSISNSASAQNTFNTLTVNGNLSGNGTLDMSTNLQMNTGDFINVLGTASGQEKIVINNVIQNADPSTTNVVKLVQTTGGGNFTGFTDAGTFQFAVLPGNGSALTPDPNAWYLEYTSNLSATANAAIGSFSSGLYLFFSDMQTLIQRMGELRLSHASGFWVKPYGNHMMICNQVSREFDQSAGGFDAGIDRYYNSVRGGQLNVGVFGGYLYASQNFHQSSTGVSQGLSLGAYATWFHAKGWYVDAAAKYFQLWNNFQAYTNTGTTSTANYSVPAVGASLEVGKRINFNAAKKVFFVEPQAQILTADMQGMNYAASNGLLVSGNNQTSLQGRIGSRAGMHFNFSQQRILEPYLQASLLQELSGNNTISTNTTSFTTQLPSTVGQFGAGATFKASNHAYAYGEYDYAFGSHFREPIAVSAGIRWVF